MSICPKQANFRESLQRLQAKIENLANIFRDPVQKRFEIVSPIFEDILFSPRTVL